MPKKGKSNKPRKECYTRSGGAKGKYVVCNDPPKGSKGQAGVYKRKTSKADADKARKKKEKDKEDEIADRKRRKEEYREKTADRRRGDSASSQLKDGSKKYVDHRAEHLGGKRERDNWRASRAVGKRPKVDTMRKHLVKAGARESSLIGMGLTYVMDRWLAETPEGKKYNKKYDGGLDAKLKTHKKEYVYPTIKRRWDYKTGEKAKGGANIWASREYEEELDYGGSWRWVKR